MALWSGRLVGTPLIFDNFSEATAAAPIRQPLFFVSHAHTDHLQGLAPRRRRRANDAPAACAVPRGPIFCTRLTAQILVTLRPSLARRGRIRVLSFYPDVHSLRYRCPEASSAAASAAAASASCSSSETRASAADSLTAYSVHSTLRVIVLPAFHCPGSCMFLVHAPTVGCVLYTGDFRFTTAPMLTAIRLADPLAAAAAAAQLIATHSAAHTRGGWRRLLARLGVAQVDAMLFDATFAHSGCGRFPSKHAAVAKIIHAVLSADRAVRALWLPDAAGGSAVSERTAGAAAGSGSSGRGAWQQPRREGDVCARLQVFLSSNDLGSEEILLLLQARFPRDRFYCADAARIAELRAIDACRDRLRWAATEEQATFVLKGVRGFHTFAQQLQQQPTSGVGNVLLHLIARPRADSLQQRTSLPERFALLLRPTTMYFVSNRIDVAQLAKHDPLAASAAAQKSDAVLISAAAEFPSGGGGDSSEDWHSVPCVVDQWGVYHVLYSMHSDVHETIELARAVRPKYICAVVPPMCLDNEFANRRAQPGTAPPQAAAAAAAELLADDSCTESENDSELRFRRAQQYTAEQVQQHLHLYCDAWLRDEGVRAGGAATPAALRALLSKESGGIRLQLADGCEQWTLEPHDMEAFGEPFVVSAEDKPAAMAMEQPLRTGRQKRTREEEPQDSDEPPSRRVAPSPPLRSLFALPQTGQQSSIAPLPPPPPPSAPSECDTFDFRFLPGIQVLLTRDIRRDERASLRARLQLMGAVCYASDSVSEAISDAAAADCSTRPLLVLIDGNRPATALIMHDLLKNMAMQLQRLQHSVASDSRIMMQGGAGPPVLQRAAAAAGELPWTGRRRVLVYTKELIPRLEDLIKRFHTVVSVHGRQWALNFAQSDEIEMFLRPIELRDELFWHCGMLSRLKVADLL